MTSFARRVCLGKSQLQVGPLGVAGGYGIDERSLLEAFERGVNYWYHGSVRGRGMRNAIRTLVKRGQRNEIVVVLQSYSRLASLLDATFKSGLRSLNIEHADVLLLGLHNSPPSPPIIERAIRLREQGLVRHLAVSAHRRAAYAEHQQQNVFDLFHVRYSAAHPGAEQDVVTRLPSEGRPGLVAYTATRWGQLLDPSRMPPGEAPLRGRDCYRFVLSNPQFNVCMTGPRNADELREALATLDEGPLAVEEEQRVRRIGLYVRAQRTLYQRLRAGRASVLDSGS
jgi:aryl-alcohol dehydrogenase-like predicted oxidoreductase